MDGVFAGAHQGPVHSTAAAGNVPYYIDGGAGGELYTEGPVGTDHGYWHGFRLVRVGDGGVLATDTVPIFVREGIRIEGARSVRPGKDVRFEAFGRQPVFKDPAKVEALELRDPDPVRPVSELPHGRLGRLRARRRLGARAARAPAAGRSGADRPASPAARRRLVGVSCATAGVAVVGSTGMSLAQQSAPTTTPLESLPNPARVFATSNPAGARAGGVEDRRPSAQRAHPDHGRPVPRRAARARRASA